MKITNHPFTNTDAEYELLKKLLLEVETHPELDNCWEPNRMDGWRYKIHAEKDVDFFRANAHYWKTESDQTGTSQVVALFISEHGRDDFFIVVHPGFLELFSDVLRWGLEFWAPGKTKVGTDVYTYGQHKIEPLLAAGFYEECHMENVRTYHLGEYDFTYNLKPGFKLISFAEYGNYESRVKLAQNAFNNPNSSEAGYRSMQNSPNYQPELDLVVVNSEGESVAYCTGWVEENNPTIGCIEPMGTHSDYRKNGFGKALAKECFKRLANMGVENAWIVSLAEPNVSNFLYESLNPTSVKQSYRYSLKLEE